MKLKNINTSYKRLSWIFYSVIILYNLTSNAQQIRTDNLDVSSAEKIYLQLDNNIYTPGNTIWFKSIVANTTNHIPTSLSNILYVELITPQEKIYQKRIVKLKNGIGQGSFYLDKKLSEGRYLIRAYTEWNKNFGDSFFYKNYVEVISPVTKKDPISDITIVKNDKNENCIKAILHPNMIDKLQKRKLKVYVMLDGKKDTLLIKKDKDNNYLIDYSMQNKSPFVTLKMQTEHQKYYSKTILLDKDFIDVQFFPESGELVHGIQSRVGFKVLDVYGKGKQTLGNIVDEKGQVITSFKSNTLGMGSFVLNKVDSTKTYYAKLNASKKESELYKLPAVASKGNVLSVTKQSKRIVVSATSNYLKNDSVSVRISCRGTNIYNIKTILNNGGFQVFIPTYKLPEGIISCTMMDNLKQPIAERLFFNARPTNRLNIHLSTNKKSYSKRELTEVNIKTTNGKEGLVNANVSLLTINKKQMGDLQSTRQNILSYFLVESELKGSIENPGFYFRGDSIKHNELDVLMLTQGWRKYKYERITKQEFIYSPEKQLSVSGHVSSPFFKKKRKEAELTLITFGEKKTFQTQKTDSLGQFKFNLKDEYGEDLKVLIQSAKKSGKKKNYNIHLQADKNIPFKFHHQTVIKEPDSIVQTFVKKNKERENDLNDFLFQSGNLLLDEVELNAYKMTPNRKKVMERFGKPDIVIDGEEIRKKEKKWSYGLYSVLLFNYPEKIEIIRNSINGGELHASIYGADTTLVVIDGVPVMPYDYPLIPYIPTSEVSSFEVIENSKDFFTIYAEVTGSLPPDDVKSLGIISIHTYSKKGLYGVQPAVGITQAKVPVFSPVVEFYAPKYDNTQDNDWNQPDFRALIHWESSLQTNLSEETKVSFYNADNSGKMTIVVEAISENGEIGYKELDYLVDDWVR